MSGAPRSFIEFQQRFGSEDACAAYLFEARWPAGFRCPACGHASAWPNRGKRFTFQCARCNRQTSVTSGTLMHGSKLPLTLWFWAAYLVASHSNGLSALQLKSQLGLGSYKTAWLLLAKLRRAMVTSGRSLLDGLVEVDETTIPIRSKDEPPDGGQGRSHRGKVRVACAAEVKDRALCRIRLEKIEDFSKASLHAFVEKTVSPGARVKTDGWPSYAGLEAQTHEPQTVGSMPAHIVLPWVHRVASNLKRWALGVYHGLRKEHLQTYLDEFVFRFNRRKNRAAGFVTLLRNALQIPAVTYQMLIEAEPAG
jgi:transposase-like protein